MDGKGKSQSEWSGVRATGIFRLAGGFFAWPAAPFLCDLFRAAPENEMK